MIITQMQKEHLSAVMKIERDSFTHPWSEHSFVSELENPKSYAFVAIDNDEVIGFAVLSVVLDEGSLLDIAVDKSYRRKGVAKKLFEAVQKVAEDNKLSFITLEVRVSGTPAISLYKAMGFEQVAIRKNYYSNPIEDAVLMTKFFETGE